MGEQKKQTGHKGLEKTQVKKNLSREKNKVTGYIGQGKEL